MLSETEFLLATLFWHVSYYWHNMKLQNKVASLDNLWQPPRIWNKYQKIKIPFILLSKQQFLEWT